MKITVIILVMAVIISSISIAQETNQEPVQQQSRVPATRIETLNNGQYTITYNPRDLTGIIKAEKKQTPGQTQAMLWIHSDAQNSDYGLIKSGNIKKKSIENQRGDTIPILEVSNRTVGAIFENDFVMINGTFKIKKGTRHDVTTNEGTWPVQTAYFELEREANLELSPTENNKLQITCKDERCKRIIGFGDAEGLTTTANWLNIRGEANVTLQIENQEAAGIAVRNIAGILPITGEREPVGKVIMIFGIPYLDRNPGSLLAWNKIKSEMPVMFLQTYGNNGQVLKSGMQSPTFDRINVYDTCATPNCWFTTFMSENGAPVAFFLGNSPILQMLNGKMAFVKQDSLYSSCLLEAGTTCVKSDETGNNLKISLTGDSKIKIEPTTQIRTLNFERLIEDNSEVVVEGNGKRLIFNKEGVKYTGPEAWYSLRTSFSINELIGGRRRLLECNAETRKCYVDGKETLSPELRSCTSNDECGPEEKCSDNICVAGRECQLYRGNADSSETRADLLVISAVDSYEQLKQVIDASLFTQESLFETEPFSSQSNQDKFNIWMMLMPEGNGDIFSRTSNWKQMCPIADYSLIIGNEGQRFSEENGGLAYTDGSAYVFIQNNKILFRRVITHEMGHLIGRLGEEYTTEFTNVEPEQNIGPNCARTFEEARIKFGESLAQQADRNGWVGCGGDCDFTRYHCDQWLTILPTEFFVDNEDRGNWVGTSIMGDHERFGEFENFDKNIIQQRLNRRSA